MYYSIVIPVFNRPDELGELLNSLCHSTYKHFEVIVVEDGSTLTSEEVVRSVSTTLDINYITQKNTGPGLARNFGALYSKGDYIIFLDSDTITPNNYLEIINTSLNHNKVDIWGGVDNAMADFTDMQKAINYSMTSMFTTGGIRGSKTKSLAKFLPRSFNMGISREVFNATGGFSSLRVGEDIDFGYTALKMGFTTALIEDSLVYHKRRNSRLSFFKQVFSFGKARVLVSKRHKGTMKLVHALPSLFLLFCIFSITTMMVLPLAIIALIWFFDSLKIHKNITIALLSVETSFIQTIGYGAGFICGLWNCYILKD